MKGGKVKKENKDVVVITGASAGLGRAIAKEFASHGARVALLARGKDRLESAKKEIEGMGGEALTFSVDVANAEQLDAVASQVEQKWGSIDIWVNNAMVGVLSPVKEMEPEEYKRVLEVNFLGQVNGTLAALKRMLPRNKGTIVLVGSALAYRGIPLQSAYCASKHAVQGFFDSLRAELLHDRSKVRVTMPQLPAMNTPQFDWMRNKMPNSPRPMGTIYQPEVAARAVYYSAYHNVREFMVGKSTLVAIVGNKLFPGLGDKFLAKKGYKGQQTKEKAEQRPDNLFDPVEGNYGAHGRFDKKAKSKSKEVWLGRHREIPIAAAVLTGLTVVALLFNR
jgi:short-subunit dehydrogenase